MADNTPCYVGETACGCFVAAMVQEGCAKHEARFVAQLIRDGLKLRMETVTWVRENLRFCEHRQPKKGAHIASPGLFDAPAPRHQATESGGRRAGHQPPDQGE